MDRRFLETDFADVLNVATEFVEIFEDLPARHERRDRSRKIEPPTSEVEPPKGAAASALLGSFYATVPDPPMAMLDHLISRLASDGAPTIAVCAVRSALQSIGEFQQKYIMLAWAPRTLGWFFETVLVYAGKARETLDAADTAFKSWVSTRPTEKIREDIAPNGDEFVDMPTIAKMRGIQRESATTWVRRTGMTTYKNGRRGKCVLRSDLLKEMREDPPTSAE